MKELRIGLVLYGGVALAVYINGVVTEIWHVLRASRALADEKEKNGGSLELEPPGYLSSTARLYFELLKDLAKQGNEIRVVVDTVAGTSAGGVNGVALYKAIVEGGDASLLNGVWLKDADISNLKGEPDTPALWLRSLLWTARKLPPVGRIAKAATLGGALEWEWVRNTVITLVRGKDPRRTPLKGDFFTRIIGKCLWQMGRPRPGAFRLLPSSGSFDLFLTRTDLHGWPRHLPLSRTYHEKPLKERTQAHVMRFEILPKDAGGQSYPDGARDIELTYAARTTASFPIAFAPMTFPHLRDELTRFTAAEFGDLSEHELGQLNAHYARGMPPDDETFARRHLGEHVLADLPAQRARVVDGGFLDNRPFTHVTEAIERKPADRQVVRVVAYIEPDPEVFDPDTKKDTYEPKAEEPGFGELLGQMFRLFRYEPILGDLRAVDARNAKVRDMNDYLASIRPGLDGVVQQVLAAHFDGRTESLRQRLDDCRFAANDTLRRNAMSGYGGYVGLKLKRAADLVAELLCRDLNLPYDSQQAYNLRTATRAWLRSEGYTRFPVADDSDQAWLDFLKAFDVPYRLRRLRALVSFVNDRYADSDRNTLDACKAELAKIAFRFECAVTSVVGKLAADADRERLRVTLKDTAEPGGLSEYLTEAFGKLRKEFDAAEAFEKETLAIAFAKLAVSDGLVRAAAAELVAFAFYDVVLYAQMDAAGIGDRCTVQTLRISPYDAELIARRTEPLPSAKYSAFNGFLKRHLREIDILYGRINGAERMVSMIVHAAGLNPKEGKGDELRRNYAKAAMEAILAEVEETHRDLNADWTPALTPEDETEFGREFAPVRAAVAKIATA